MIGITAEANENFPDHDPQFQLLANFNWEHGSNPQEWAQRLKGPRTGLTLGYANYGNTDSLGSSITAMPTIEFNIFKKEKLKVLVGMGASYFTTKYDPITNPNNQGITTDITFSFRAFLHYQILSGERIDWRTGVGYFHHSNGHTNLPNQGLNSFLVSLSADIKDTGKPDVGPPDFSFSRTANDYISIRGGYGINVLSLAEVFNDPKSVYTLSGEYGKVFNNTWKIGGGAYYRFYEHYYDYIKGNESLVQDGAEFDFFRKDPWRYATNFGIYGTGEVLLNHFGIHVQIGLNLHKPAYKIDWRINEGWDNPPRDLPPNWVFGEFNTKFKLKNAISSRMGLKYYLIGTNKQPKNNIFAGVHINSNLGQADFAEVSLGYVYSFNFRDR